MSQSLPGQTAATPRATQGGVGDLLRRAREERRWTIAECAARLRIRAPYLAALEAGQYDQLPGLTYCVGFVKAYAEFLDLDGPAMVQRFKSEAAGLPLQPNLTLPSPAPVGRIPGGGPLLIAVVGLVAVVGGWVFFADDPRSLEIRIPDLPERFASMIQPRAAPLPTATAAITASPPDIAPKPATPEAALVPAPMVPAPLAAVPAPVTPAAVAQLPVASAPAPAAVVPAPAPLAPATPAPAVPAPVMAAPVAPTPMPAAPAPVAAAPAPTPAPTPIPPVPAPAPAPVTPALVAPVQNAALAPTPAPAEEGRTPAPQALGGAAPLPSNTTEEPPRAPPSLALTAPAQPEGRVFGGQNNDARVILKSNGESWVQIRDRDNSTVFTRLLSAGDSFLVPNRNGLTLWTGNAGVLEVTVDGSSAPSLGAPGAVKKNVSLDADRLKAGTAVGD